VWISGAIGEGIADVTVDEELEVIAIVDTNEDACVIFIMHRKSSSSAQTSYLIS